MSFPALMVTLVAITGSIWLLDKLFWSKTRVAGSKEPIIVEYAKSFFPIILIVLVIRSFVVEPFRIPSGSMLPSLRIGDFILVNKFEYGLRLPVLNNQILANSSAKRGDVVVFRYPPDPQIDYIKRIIGLPGDRVQYRAKKVYINGQQIAQLPQQKSIDLIGVIPMNSRVLLEGDEDKQYTIAVTPGPPRFQVDEVIPEGHYFVMGDNRDNSSDSRVWGMVSEKHLVGKAFYIWMSWDCQAGFACINWDRIGNAIQ